MTITCRTAVHDDHDVYGRLCPCRDILDLIANKWSTLVIGAIEDGPQRFGVIQKRLQGVTPKVLTATLKRLESNHLINRTVYPAVPPHVEYSLTELGETLVAPLAALRTWAEEHLDDIEAVPSAC
ncbi:DNA-binding HxlR family transcriptional regulator [Allocatelliglobosispora scoriae]|uniref:DNA-binding HxlR family transcriptional regulator n=1 Tax=Allocatelliglobosispora scoriae TaxID=643052 RepID=A0A841BHB5_9ACTN|nr:helix-turn-helix domain-containing protein [Allocatelliglobosispora scoriae]MBB5868477.1 DNA-binding HxlR family transcriptional regulator [Allocatelliglobosispora scoriae]